MADIPHLSTPFRFVGAEAHAAEVEQDSIEDIAGCVEAIIRTRPGVRIETPDLGVSDPTFMTRSSPARTDPASIDALMSEIEVWEPRASIAVTDGWDFTKWVEELSIKVREGIANG